MSDSVTITDLEFYFVRPRWQLLRIMTSEGVDGWSEAILEGNLQAVRGAVEVLRDYLIGKDPRHVGRHWQRMYTDNFYRGGPVLTSAISAIDIALWDIKGKLLGAPIYELLGGPLRERVSVYCHIRGETTDELIADARSAIAAGFRMFKTGLGQLERVAGGLGMQVPRVPTRSYIDAEVERFCALREAIGNEYEFAIDFHGRATPTVSKVLIQELVPSHPAFIEEPCLPENVMAMAEIREASLIPIATGERLFTRWGFREAIERRAADIYQPDVCHAGGISELVKIAAMADTHFAQMAPHNPLGPVALAASLQVDCACENVYSQELIRDLGAGLLERPFILVDGMIEAPRDAGLGVSVNLDAVREAGHDGSWRTPSLVYPDGSVAPW